MKYTLGIDVGSVSTNLVILDSQGGVVEKHYIRTKGRPVEAIQAGLVELGKRFGADEISGVGVTGSGRRLSAEIVGADVVKNEITAHAVAATHLVPDAQTVLEIGGQDSKIIILRQGVAVDFAMNTVCAAGTGSFLDQQAARLGIPIEEFGAYALKAKEPVRIAGRCSVFAESDMIHKQQMGHGLHEIVAGLCQAMVRNYLNNVAKGKEILPPIVFQGGVAANPGIVQAFGEALGHPIHVPTHFDVMGAVGAALLARNVGQTRFRGFEIGVGEIRPHSFNCNDCPNHCEVVILSIDGEDLARWGDKCGKWQELEPHEVATAT